jgi:hypothetical protein
VKRYWFLIQDGCRKITNCFKIGHSQVKHNNLSNKKGGTHFFWVSPQIANPQILGLIPQSRFAKPQVSEVLPVRKFVMINPQILNPQIFFMSQSANSKPQI